MVYEICKRCGRMFNKNGKKYCENCFDKNNEEQQLIVEHMRKYPNATVMDIIAETGVTLKSINCLVEEGGLSYVENKLIAEDIDANSTTKNEQLMKTNKFHLRRWDK